MRRLVSPAKLVGAGIVLLGVVLLVLWLVPSNEYIFLPDRARPVAPLVTAEGERRSKDGDGIYFVDVIVRKATLLERLFPGLREGATLVPAHAVNPPGVSEEERGQVSRREMTRSQQVAAAVALRELGYKVVARPAGALVTGVGASMPAAGRLVPTDVIVAVDGSPVHTPSDLRRLIGRREPGERVRLTIRRGRRLRDVVLPTVPSPDDPSRPIVGVVVDQAARIELPLRVRIDTGGVGGPSAGLAFALDLLEELGRDVDGGRRVAATGQIELDGRVVPVGAVKQKTLGARQAKVDIFLVPAGENAREARRYADGLRIVPVKSFRQALRALATLPPMA